MEKQSTDVKGERADDTRRRERERRILETATELFIRWGYKKTTIDDVAREAGVAKGTIYLHWKTREELFMNVLIREWLQAAQEALELIFADPNGVRLHVLTKYTLLVIMKRPLIKALLTRDTEVLGTLIHYMVEKMPTYYEQRTATSIQLFQLMQSKGLVRNDQSPAVLIHNYTAVTMGFLTVEQYLQEPLRLSPEQSVEMLADTIQRVFEPEQPPRLEDIQEVTSYIQQAYTSLLEMVQQKL